MQIRWLHLIANFEQPVCALVYSFIPVSWTGGLHELPLFVPLFHSFYFSRRNFHGFFPFSKGYPDLPLFVIASKGAYTTDHLTAPHLRIDKKQLLRTSGRQIRNFELFLKVIK